MAANLRRNDIRIDNDIQIDENGNITAYVETWFDVDAKFGTHMNDIDNAWLNMYATLNVATKALTILLVLDYEDKSEEMDYIPSEAEKTLITELITEKVKELYGQSLEEFVREKDTPNIGQSHRNKQ